MKVWEQSLPHSHTPILPYSKNWPRHAVCRRVFEPAFAGGCRPVAVAHCRAPKGSGQPCALASEEWLPVFECWLKTSSYVTHAAGLNCPYAYSVQLV